MVVWKPGSNKPIDGQKCLVFKLRAKSPQFAIWIPDGCSVQYSDESCSNCPDFGWYHKLKTNLQKSPDFECFRFLKGRLSDPHCNQIILIHVSRVFLRTCANPVTRVECLRPTQPPTADACTKCSSRSHSFSCRLRRCVSKPQISTFDSIRYLWSKLCLSKIIWYVFLDLLLFIQGKQVTIRNNLSMILYARLHELRNAY